MINSKLRLFLAAVLPLALSTAVAAAATSGSAKGKPSSASPIAHGQRLAKASARTAAASPTPGLSALSNAPSPTSSEVSDTTNLLASPGFGKRQVLPNAFTTTALVYNANGSRLVVAVSPKAICMTLYGPGGWSNSGCDDTGSALNPATPMAGVVTDDTGYDVFVLLPDAVTSASLTTAEASRVSLVPKYNVALQHVAARPSRLDVTAGGTTVSVPLGQTGAPPSPPQAA
jgi:hypothetical protein